MQLGIDCPCQKGWHGSHQYHLIQFYKYWLESDQEVGMVGDSDVFQVNIGHSIEAMEV